MTDFCPKLCHTQSLIYLAAFIAYCGFMVYNIAEKEGGAKAVIRKAVVNVQNGQKELKD